MKEQLITLDTAKLAKEKGFNIPVLYAFDDEDGLLTSSYVKDVFHPINYNSSSYKCSKPTQSLLQKWLREIFKYHVQIIRDYDGWSYQIWEFNHGNKMVKGGSCEMPDYYIELEKGLQEALKLIK